MATEEVSARLADMDKEDAITVQYDFGDNLAEAVEAYGEDVVFSAYKASTVIDLQAYMRGLIRREKSSDEIAEAVSNWKPGVKTVRGKSAAEKLDTLLGKLSPEERAALFAKYSGAEAAA